MSKIIQPGDPRLEALVDVACGLWHAAKDASIKADMGDSPGHLVYTSATAVVNAGARHGANVGELVDGLAATVGVLLAQIPAESREEAWISFGDTMNSALLSAAKAPSAADGATVNYGGQA